MTAHDDQYCSISNTKNPLRVSLQAPFETLIGTRLESVFEASLNVSLPSKTSRSCCCSELLKHFSLWTWLSATFSLLSGWLVKLHCSSVTIHKKPNRTSQIIKSKTDKTTASKRWTTLTSKRKVDAHLSWQTAKLSLKMKINLHVRVLKSGTIYYLSQQRLAGKPKK